MNENGSIAFKTAAWDLAFWKFQNICHQTGPPKSADSRQLFILSLVEVVRVLVVSCVTVVWQE